MEWVDPLSFVHHPQLQLKSRMISAFRLIAPGASRLSSRNCSFTWCRQDQVADAQAELDSFDFVEGLVIRGGTDVMVLNTVSLHGGLCGSWVRSSWTAKTTMVTLISYWREVDWPWPAEVACERCQHVHAAAIRLKEHAFYVIRDLDLWGLPSFFVYQPPFTTIPAVADGKKSCRPSSASTSPTPTVLKSRLSAG